MAGDLTNHGESICLAALTGAPWIKLHIGAPGEEGTANPAGEAKRKQATLAAPTGTTPTLRVSTTDLIWPEVSTAETITHVSAWTAESDGACEWVAALTSPVTLSVGNTLEIPTGDLSISLD